MIFGILLVFVLVAWVIYILVQSAGTLGSRPDRAEKLAYEARIERASEARIEQGRREAAALQEKRDKEKEESEAERISKDLYEKAKEMTLEANVIMQFLTKKINDISILPYTKISDPYVEFRARRGFMQERNIGSAGYIHNDYYNFQCWISTIDKTNLFYLVNAGGIIAESIFQKDIDDFVKHLNINPARNPKRRLFLFNTQDEVFAFLQCCISWIMLRWLARQEGVDEKSIELSAELRDAFEQAVRASDKPIPNIIALPTRPSSSAT